MSAFGALLRHNRVRAALSQNACARAAGVDVAYVNRIENGHITPERSLIRRAVVVSLTTALRLGPIDTDLLLIAAGHAPEIVLRMSERQLRALYTLTGEDAVEPARLKVAQ